MSKQKEYDADEAWREQYEPPEGEGDWYCGNCRTALDGSRVTFDERCDTCYHPVEWIPVPQLSTVERQAARIQQLEGALQAIGKYIENWDMDCSIYHVQDVAVAALTGDWDD